MNGPRRTWLTIGVTTLGLVGAAVLSIVGYYLLFPDPTENSLAYTDQISAHAGYADVSRYKGGGESCNCVQRWYIGPAGVDPTTVFTGPNLTWSPVFNDPLKNGWQPLAHAVGSTSSTGTCDLLVARERPEYAGGRLADALNLLQDQANAWRDGNLDILELDVTCERDSGRL